jgi:ankyrin repeat protein
VYDQIKYVSIALEAGASPNTNSEGGCSPLIAAVVQNDTASLDLLIAASANIHDYGSAEIPDAIRKKLYWESSQFSSPKLSPIQWAAFMDYVEVAKILCEAGADVNQPGHGNPKDTALILAVRSGKYAMTEFLVAQMTEIDPYWDLDNLLVITIEYSRGGLVELLLRNNADPNQPSLSMYRDIDDDFVTPLEAACRHKDISTVKRLLSNGADASQGCPLSSVFQLNSDGERYDRLLELIELLLVHGADVNARDYDEGTALQRAIEEEEFYCAYQVIDNGACINAPASEGERGRTALQAAASAGDVDMVEHLLSRGADVNAPAVPKFGVTALQAAAIRGYLGIAKILLEHGADIDAEAAILNGRTAVDGAAEFGRIDMVKLLLDNYQGSKISEVIENAYLAAKEGCQWHVMELLKTY